ncbi:hypothetical protein P3T25_009846 [Paraburkholderia sp. GAS32]
MAWVATWPVASRVVDAESESKQLQDGRCTAARVLMQDNDNSGFALCDYVLQTGLLKVPTRCKSGLRRPTLNLGRGKELVRREFCDGRYADQNPLLSAEH